MLTFVWKDKDFEWLLLFECHFYKVIIYLFIYMVYFL